LSAPLQAKSVSWWQQLWLSTRFTCSMFLLGSKGFGFNSDFPPVHSKNLLANIEAIDLYRFVIFIHQDIRTPAQNRKHELEKLFKYFALKYHLESEADFRTRLYKPVLQILSTIIGVEPFMESYPYEAKYFREDSLKNWELYFLEYMASR